MTDHPIPSVQHLERQLEHAESDLAARKPSDPSYAMAKIMVDSLRTALHRAGNTEVRNGAVTTVESDPKAGASTCQKATSGRIRQ